MVWLYVIGYFVMGLVAVYGDVFMANNYYSEKYRDGMKGDRSDIAAMIGCCLFFWWVIIPFQLIYMLAFKVQKGYK